MRLVLREPDYGVPIVKVFTRVASRLITSGVGLDILSAIHPSCKRVEGLPSWVPDWSASEPYQDFRRSIKDEFFHFEKQHPVRYFDKNGILRSRTNTQLCIPPQLTGLEQNLVIDNITAMALEYLPIHNSCLGSKPHVRVSESEMTITFSGMVVDTIEETSTIGPTSELSMLGYQEVLKSWKNVAFRGLVPNPQVEYRSVPASSYAHDKDKASIAFCSTLMAGHIYTPISEVKGGFLQFIRHVHLQTVVARCKSLLRMKADYEAGVLVADNLSPEIIEQLESHTYDGIKSEL